MIKYSSMKESLSDIEKFETDVKGNKENEDEQMDNDFESSYLSNQLEKDSEEYSEAKIIKLAITVDPESGSYKTIQDAINAVKEGELEPVVIKVNSEVYKENLYIRNKSLVIKLKDSNSEVYISGESGPTLIIDNDPKHVVELCGIKLSFKGYRENQPEMLNKSMDERSKEPEDANNEGEEALVLKDCYEAFNNVGIKEDSNSIVMLRRGKLVMRQCVVSLDLMLKDFKSKVVSMVVLEGAHLDMQDCEVRGKIEMESLGMFVDKGNVKLNKVHFRNFKKGACMLNANAENVNSIQECLFTFNKTVGLLLMGTNNHTIVEKSDIERNECPGIKILPGNRSIIRNNMIKINTYGILIHSADPIILMNKIKQNYRSGITVQTVKSRQIGRMDTRRADQEKFMLIARPRIIANEISSNKEHGILCQGGNNISVIQDNIISYNLLCGIKTQMLAGPMIKFNKISKNNSQGILLVENSWATIIHNTISENLKANVALGGAESTNTFICRNKIKDGISEGIFIVRSGKCVVRGNLIRGNRDGIIMADSLAEVTSNEIIKNQKHGIFLLQSSKPTIKYNQILENEGSGIYVKGRANPLKIAQNKFENNIVAILFERKCANMENVKKSNEIDESEGINGVVFPSVGCSLI